MGAPIKNLTGQRFGKLLAVAATGARTDCGKVIWRCQCDCGNFRDVCGTDLTSGRIHMCRECAEKVQQGFGLKLKDYDRLKNIYHHMKARCHNPSCDNYKHYGGRGIKVCKEWLNDFDTFVRWANTSGYDNGLTIERTDVDGDYCPENCKWIPQKEQLYNRTNTIYIHFKGKKFSLARMASELNYDYSRIINYLVRNAT